MGSKSLNVIPYSHWVSAPPSQVSSGKVVVITHRYLYFTTLAMFLLVIASTQRQSASSHLKRCGSYFLHSAIGQKIHTFYITRCIERAYYIDDALYVDINLSTLSTHSRLHIQTLAGLLRKYPHATKMLSLSVIDRSAPNTNQETATKKFASELLTQFVVQDSLKDHPLFQRTPDGYRLLPMHRQILSEEDIALCRDIGTILGAWGMSPFLQEYTLGQLFPIDFYIGLVFLIRSEWLEQPFYELSRQDREHICLFFAHTTVGNALYEIPWQEGFEKCSDKQLHTLWNLIIETIGQQIIDETTWKNNLRHDSEIIKWMHGYLQGYAYKTCYAQAAALHAVAQGMKAAWPRLKRYLNKNFVCNEYAARALSTSIQGMGVTKKRRDSVKFNFV